MDGEEICRLGRIGVTKAGDTSQRADIFRVIVVVSVYLRSCFGRVGAPQYRKLFISKVPGWRNRQTQRTPGPDIVRIDRLRALS